MKTTLAEPTSYQSSPACSVVRTNAAGNISVFTNAEQAIGYDLALFNDNGCFNVVTGTFTAPRAGRVVAYNTVPFKSNSNTIAHAALRVVRSGSSYVCLLSRLVLDTGQYGLSSGSHVTDVSVGDTISPIAALFTSNAEINVVDFGTYISCHFQLHYLT